MDDPLGFDAHNPVRGVGRGREGERGKTVSTEQDRQAGKVG